MNTKFRICALLTGLATAAAVGVLSSAPAQTPAIDNTAFEVQTRGPVHEAFAQPGEMPLEPGAVVPQQPPPPIPEVPPDMRPDGANVQWFGGYWAWDADRNEFEWISGAYRDVPPGRKYVAGYWEQAPTGWRWVAGLWAPDGQQELPYVPQPPASLEIGPTLPPPSDDYFYAPGTWLYQSSRYVWQPGSYVRYRPGLVWCPPHYTWTPCGYLFVSGFWDYPVEHRGLLFAPVVFHRPLWNTPGWAWRPQFAVGFGPLFNSLFIDVRFGHYRFGDYYGTAYVNRGIQPWHVLGPRRHDPLFSYYQWQNRGNPGWQAGLNNVYNDRLAGRQSLPPRTLTQQNVALKQGNTANVNLQVVQPITQFNDKSVRLSKVSSTVLSQQQTFAKQQQNSSQARFNIEAGLAKGPALSAGKAAAPRVLNLTDVSKGFGGKSPLPAAVSPGKAEAKAIQGIAKSPGTTIPNKAIQGVNPLPSNAKSPGTTIPNKAIQGVNPLPSNAKSPGTTIPNKAIQGVNPLPSNAKSPGTTIPNKAIQGVNPLPSNAKSPGTTIPNKAIQGVNPLPSITKSSGTTIPNKAIQGVNPLPSNSKSSAANLSSKAIQSAKSLPATVKSSPPITKQAAPSAKIQTHSSSVPALKKTTTVTRAASPPAPSRPTVQSRTAPRSAATAASGARSGKKK